MPLGNIFRDSCLFLRLTGLHAVRVRTEGQECRLRIASLSFSIRFLLRYFIHTMVEGFFLTYHQTDHILLPNPRNGKLLLSGIPVEWRFRIMPKDTFSVRRCRLACENIEVLHLLENVFKCYLKFSCVLKRCCQQYGIVQFMLNRFTVS